MTISINGVAIANELIACEARNHEYAPDPARAAAYALAVRELLLQRAREAGYAQHADVADECESEAAIERLLAAEAPVPEPTEEECRRYYEAHIDRYTAGELVEASHILFGVTPNAPVDAIRAQAEAIVREAVAEPEQFGDFAKRFSNCPSGAQGGNLGQIRRGDMVPEFERAIFGQDAGVLPRLVNTRYGFHVVRIERRIPGRIVDFEAVRPRIAEALSAGVQAKAAEQYVRILASKATITGIDLAAAGTALLQ